MKLTRRAGGRGSPGRPGLGTRRRGPMMMPLERPATSGGSPSRRRAGRVAAGVVFALTPWVTLGFGTPIAFIAAAAVFSSWRRAHATVLWISAAVYTTVFIGYIAASAGNPSGIIAGAYLLIMVLGGGAQALFTVLSAGAGQADPARDLRRRRRPATAITLRPADARPGRAAVVTAVEYHVTVRYQAADSAPVTFAWEGDQPPPVGTCLRVYDLPAPTGDAILATASDKQDD